ncbi:MAG: hypothetical protein FD167_5053 [bacterium]|nr:MAG: hypothetical protein FD167_5053 [bacterium]
MITQNETEKSPTCPVQKAIEPVDIARRMLIWQWVLDPKGVKPPTDLSKEELVEVYYLCRESLSKFTETLNRVGQTQNQIRAL